MYLCGESNLKQEGAAFIVENFQSTLDLYSNIVNNPSWKHLYLSPTEWKKSLSCLESAAKLYRQYLSLMSQVLVFVV